MAYNPRIRYGGELRHVYNGVWSGRGRKPIALGGAPNGFSNDPNRKPTGKVATWQRVQMPDGSVRYIDPNANPATAKYFNSSMGQRVANTISTASANKYQQKQQQVNSMMRPGMNNATAKNIDANLQREQQIQRGIAAGRKRKNAREQAAQQKAVQQPTGIGGFVQKSKSALGGLAGKVGERFASATGNIRNTMKKTGETVGNWLNERRTDLGNLWDGRAGKGSAKDLANEARSNSSAYRDYAKRSFDSGDYNKANAYAKASNKQKREANRQQEAYDRSIVGRAEKAKNDVVDWFNKRGDDVRGAAEKARKAVGEARENIGNAWDGRAGKGSAKDLANEARSNAKTYHDYARRDAKAGNAARGSAYAKASRNASAEARKQQEAYDRSIVGRAEKAKNDVVDWVNKRGDEARQTGRNVKKNVTEWGNQAGDNIRGAADKAKKAAEGKFDEASKFVKGVAKNTKTNIENTASNAGNLLKGYKLAKSNLEVPADAVRQYDYDLNEFIYVTPEGKKYVVKK